MVHKFNIEKAKKLDSPERFAQEDPSVLFDAVGLRPGMAVADIGCGTGFYTVPMAKRVGPGGMVRAVDIQQEMIDLLAAKIEEEGLLNVELNKSEENSIPIPDTSLDAVFLVNTLHEAESKEALLSEINRMLRNGGKLILVDWRKLVTPDGPPLAERLDEDEAEELLLKSGFGNFQKIVLTTDLYGIEAEKV